MEYNYLIESRNIIKTLTRTYYDKNLHIVVTDEAGFEKIIDTEVGMENIHKKFSLPHDELVIGYIFNGINNRGSLNWNLKLEQKEPSKIKCTLTHNGSIKTKGSLNLVDKEGRDAILGDLDKQYGHDKEWFDLTRKLTLHFLEKIHNSKNTLIGEKKGRFLLKVKIGNNRKNKKIPTDYIVKYIVDGKEFIQNTIKIMGKIEYSYAFRVVGHWRRLTNPQSISKDRGGNYNIIGSTWVVPSIRKKELSLIEKVKVLK